MARGFESKDVEFQQSEADRRPSGGRPLTPDERRAREERATCELALKAARADLAKASAPAHRRMLEQAIEQLNQQLLRLASAPHDDK